MTDSIREQIHAIDSARDWHIELVAKRVQPLARAVNRVLNLRGKIVGRFRKRKEYHSGKLRFRKTRRFFSVREIEVHYDNKLVFHFDTSLLILDRECGKYLFFFRGGEWEQAVVEEYRDLAFGSLCDNFDVNGEMCKWFNADVGVCSKYKARLCPCEEYNVEEEDE